MNRRAGQPEVLVARLTVSVCTPTYQGAERLKRVAPRLLAALGPGDEWLVAVDGSTDETQAVLAALSRDDARVRPLVHQSNRGRTASLNAACAAATSDIVLRLDDDILVEQDFIELHAAAHAAASSPIGVVQPITDVIQGELARGKWAAFIERNSANDRQRAAALEDGLPAMAWGAACSLPRGIGSSLGWYDERFTAYGWEDVEFGFRLIRAGVRLVEQPLARVRHLTHWTTFRHKFDRGLEAGARMALFATIHGPQAVLVALGRDPRDYTIPRRTSTARRAALAASLDAPAVRIACIGEAVLSRIGTRRVYDAWAARWLTWSYGRGWSAEVARRSLPALPSPPTWKPGGTPAWAESWKRIVEAMAGMGTSEQDLTAIMAGRAIARSVFLRHLEAGAKPSLQRWREATTAVARLIQYRLLLAQAGVCATGATDVLVVADAATPSMLGRGLAAARSARRIGLAPHILCSTPLVAAAARATEPSMPVTCATAWRSSHASPGQPVSFIRSLAIAERTTRLYSHAVAFPFPGRIQLAAEGMVALTRPDSCRAILAYLAPSVVVSASEYSDLGAVMVATAREAGVPFVTLQHGVINMLFAPYFANRYLVSSALSREALLTLGEPVDCRIDVVDESMGQSDLRPLGDGERLALRRSIGASPTTQLIGVYSQTHGAEFSAATHFTFAAQLEHLLSALPDTVVAIKRHPSERHSEYETLLDGRYASRVVLAPTSMSARAFAQACDVVCALASTGLRDAMLAGCPAVEVTTEESLVVQPIAALRIPLTDIQRTLSAVLVDDATRFDLVERQRADIQSTGDASLTLDMVLRELAARVMDA